MPTDVTEKQVQEIWQDSLQHRTDLLTEAKESVRIIYPGRRNDDRGADFKDAVITTGLTQFQGDIEIHVKASSWWAHGHHRDPAYNRVILHVVYQNDSENDIVLQNGARAPTLALHGYIKTNNRSALTAIPCRHIGYRGNMGFIGRMLEEAGEQRFLAQAAYFKESIAQGGAGQSLYQGIMTALGYSKNKQPMEELAGLMPLEKLETAALIEMPDNEYLARCQSLLTGAAGLLPSQRGAGYPAPKHIDEWEAKLDNIWARSDTRSGMSAADWHYFKVRPGNHPVRRLAAMSHLLLRYRKKGLLAGLVEKLQEAGDDNGRLFLEQALTVTPDDYWGCYLDFGVPARGAVPALIGNGRAADIIINVLLPFAYARGPALPSEKTIEVYRNYPAPEENALVEHMRRQLGMSKSFIATARRQQGLIHLYKTGCSQGKCSECRITTANI